MIPRRSQERALRLYRGLTRPYDPARVDGDRLTATDFTDCPFTALGYAAGRTGVVLVLDVPEHGARVTEELWFGPPGAKRIMIWGRFDSLIIAAIPAKELRAEARRRGVAAASDEDKAMILRARIEARLPMRPTALVG